MKIIIIGGGNMGITFAKAFINNHVVTPEQLMILEKDNGEKISKLQGYELGQIFTDPAKVREAELVILAVKPQDAANLFAQIKDHVEEGQVFLSIMAGVTIKTIVESLQVTKVIRAMPNLPSQIGLGMTAYHSSDEVSRFEEQYIQNLLQKTGKTLNVRNEALIDSVTAISGSGPAYIYYFMDAMINAATEMGINKIDAEMLVKQTFRGALSLLQQNSYSCKEWIGKVASKGGTTEAAIEHFDAFDLSKIITDGAKEALKRAEELGVN